jgi:TP901 family phage tail tape measure protein
MPLRVQTVQTGLEQSIQKAVRNVNRRGGLNIAINDRQFTRPLGKITGSVSEFNKSLEASNARVLAFGASVGMIQGVQKAFAALITTTIRVEKQMAEINVVMGATNKQLEKFGEGLFNVARNTAQSFSTVATAATELARQGLSMEETLKRANDALILTRLTGLDAASAVSGLTAALNTFNKAGLDSTKVLSKMAAVDVQFAVSTEDLIDAVSRAGAVAQDAGVSFDELLGAVTAAQQQTARGGKVIGNSFKTIFTRVQRQSTIKRLEELGIAVRDVTGSTLPAIQILTNLSKTYETLADTTKAAVAEQVGGVFQINILKAAIKDLTDQNSILARATRASSQATDEAIKKNELLNKTLSAISSQAAVSLEEFTNVVGSLAFEDNLKILISSFNELLKSRADWLKNGEEIGAITARGLIKGLGNFLTGPTLILALGVLGKLFLKTFAFLGGSVKELIGITTASQKQRDIQKSIVAVLGENSALQKKILSQEGNRAAQEKTILSILQAQSREQAKIAAAAAAIGPAVMRSGYNAQFKRTRSEGHIPNYVSGTEASAERSGAKSGGYSPGAVKSMKMPGQGRVVYNSAEKVKSFPGMVQPAIMPPPRSRAGKKYQKAFAKTHGFNPYASGGFVPNFARGLPRDPRGASFSGENAAIIARALIHGKTTAMNLNMGGGKRFKDTWHSFAPAMATGNEMNSIRERIYKKFIQGKGSDFRNQVNASLRKLTVPKEWGSKDSDLIFGMVESLNSARKSSRKLELPYSKGFVPNFARGLPRDPRGQSFSGENAVTIARALIHGKTTAMNLNMGGGKRFKDTWHSFAPAMATGNEMNSIRERIYKNFIQNKGSDFRGEVNKALKNIGGKSVEKWGTGGVQDDLVYGMVEQLNSARKSSRKLELPYSKGFVPNFGMRLNANKIKSIGKGKIHSDKFDGTIGMKELDNILTTGLFKSLNYTSKAGNDLTYTNARWGVNQYKKGAPPPGNYVSYGEMDKATGTRSMWIGSTGEGADAFRKLKLKKISSIVSQGKHLKVDPSMANLGFIPNYSAFHYDKNIEQRMLKGGQNKFTPTPIQMLEFMPEKQLTAAMEKYIKHSLDPSIGFEFKGSYPGMPIKEFKNHFPVGDIYKGLGVLNNKRMGEILQNPDITKSFFRYLTGKSTSIGIETALTADEKKHFKDKYGMIPRIKSADEISGNTKEKRLDSIRSEFLLSGGTPDADTGTNLKKIQGFIKKFTSSSGIGPGNQRQLLKQNKTFEPPPIYKRPGGPIADILSRMSRSGNPKAPRGAGGLALGSQYIDKDGNLKTVTNKFGATSGRFRGDEAITRRAVDSGVRRQIEYANLDAYGSTVGKERSIKDLIPSVGEKINNNAIEEYADKNRISLGRAAIELGLDKGKAGPRIESIKEAFLRDQATSDIDEKQITKRNLKNLPSLRNLLYSKRFRGMGGKNPFDANGHIPNYMLRRESMAMHARHKMNSSQSRQASKLKRFILKRDGLDSAAKPYEMPGMSKLFDMKGNPIDRVKFGGDYRAAVVTKDGSTYMGRFHDDIRDELAKKKISLKDAADLELTWSLKNMFNKGMIPNYGLGNLFRKQKPKTSDRDFLGKGLGAAGKLISTPLKDIGSLLKGGYNMADKGGDLIRRGIIGTAKGGYNAYTNIFEAGKHGLGKGFDLMKKFPRATLYGGGGGLGYKFQDQIMGAMNKYGPKALEMGSKMGKGVLDVFQNPTNNIDLISAVLGGALPASVLGFTLLDDVLKLREQKKAKKLQAEKKLANENLVKSLKSKGKTRTNLRIGDLPDELKRIAIARLRVDPRYGNKTSMVPKSLLDEIGMSGGFIPNFNLFSPSAKETLSSNPQYAKAVSKSIAREASFGVTPKVVSAPSLKSSTNPGLAVVNQEQEGGKLSNARMLHGGLNPKQGASNGVIPNYAAMNPGSVNASVLTNIQASSIAQASSQGLRSSQFIKEAARDVFDFAGAGKKATKELEKAQSAFKKISVSASEAAVRTKAFDGALKTAGDKALAKQVFRSDAAAALKSDKTYGGIVNSLMGKDGKLSETRLKDQMAIAKASGDDKTEKQLKNLNKHLDVQARKSMDQPRHIGTSVASALAKESVRTAKMDALRGDGGYSKKGMRETLSAGFLQSQNIKTDGMSKDQLNKTMSSFFAASGARGQSAFTNFAKEQGVKSSISSLARAGMMTGDLKSLTGGNNRQPFIKAMQKLEKAYKNDAKPSVIKKRSDAALAAAAKVTTGQSAANTNQLMGAVSNLNSTLKGEKKAADKREKQKTAQEKARGNMASNNRFMRAYGNFQMSRASPGGGAGLGGRLGNISNRVGGSLGQFASGMKGFGGSAGLGLSFALPMLAGFVGPKGAKMDRSEFKDGQFKVKEEFQTRERASSVMMGAGMGALFGLPGMIAGTAIGFAASSRSMIVSIEDMVKAKEKEMQITNQNIASVSKLQNLQQARASALAKGDDISLDRIDSAINSAMSGITDMDILEEAASNAGSAKGLSTLQKRLQDDLSQQTSVQNFALANQTNNVRNAGTSLANIIDQRLRSGQIKGGQKGLEDTLKKINKNMNASQATGEAISKEELLRLRTTAAGKGDIVTGSSMGFGLTAAALTAGALLIPFTGGGSMMAALGMTKMAAAGTILAGGVVGGQFGRQQDQESAQLAIANIEEGGTAAYNALADLADIGAISKNQFETLSASFSLGKMTTNELIAEMEKAVDGFAEVRRASGVLGQQTFNIAKRFKETIRELKKEAAIEKITEGGRLKREASIIDASSRFSTGSTDSTINQGLRRLSLFNETAAFSARSFEKENAAGYLTSLEQSMNTLSLSPPLQEAMIDAVEAGGSGAAQKIVDQGELEGTVSLASGLDQDKRQELIENLGKILDKFDKKALPGIGVRRTLRANTKGAEAARNELANKFGISADDPTAIRQLSDLYDNRQNFIKGSGEGSEGNVRIFKELTEQQKSTLQDGLSVLQARRDIEIASLEAARKNQELTVASNIVQSELNRLIQERSAAINLAEIKQSGNLQRASTSRDQSVRIISFEAQNIQPINTEEEERERQERFRGEIFNQELALMQKQEMAQLKSEARRLLSDQQLVNALDGLSEQVELNIRAITGDQGKDSNAKAPGVSASPTASTSATGAILTKGLDKEGRAKMQELNKERGKYIDERDSIKSDLKRISSDMDLASSFKDVFNTTQEELKKLMPMATSNTISMGSSSIGNLSTKMNRDQKLTLDDFFGRQSRHEMAQGMGGASFSKTTIENDEDYLKRVRGFVEKRLGDRNEGGQSKQMTFEAFDNIEGSGASVDNQIKQYKNLVNEIQQTSNYSLKDLKEDASEKNAQLDSVNTKLGNVKNEILDLRASSGSSLVKSFKNSEEIKKLLHLDLKDTDTALATIEKIALEAGGADELKKAAEELKKDEGITSKEVDRINGLVELIGQSGDRIKAFIESEELRKFEQGFRDFQNKLLFTQETMGDLTTIERMTNPEAKMAQKRATSLSTNLLRSDTEADLNLKSLQMTRGVPKAFVSRARIEASKETIGTELERSNLLRLGKERGGLASQEAQRVQSLQRSGEDIKDINTDKTILTLRAEIKELDQQMSDIAQNMERSTVRDFGVIQELKQNFTLGLENGFDEIELQSESIYTTLGQNTPLALRDGLASAMQLALSGADDLGSKLQAIGVSFLQMIQNAFLQSAASRLVGSINPFNSGGYVAGGSGVKDDVPAMLTGGEYVIKKSAVQKYGVNFLEGINTGSVGGYAKGGAVMLNVKGPRAAKREAFWDTDRDGNILRYKTTEAEKGIDSRLTGYARANDAKIQEFYGEQEKQFNQDLSTKEQEKQREENRIERKTQERKAYQNALIGIAAGATLNYGIKKTADYMDTTPYGRKRSQRRRDRKIKDDFFNDGRTVLKGDKLKDVYPDSFSRKQFTNGLDRLTPTQKAQALGDAGINASVTDNGRVRFRENTGGGVPTLLTGGEYVMSPEAVQNYGPAVMRGINKGTLSPEQNQNKSQNVDNSSVNITVNVSSDGNVTQSQDSPKEFATKVKSAVMQVINNEKRVGGSLRG